jgi:hypothetical protein
MKTFGVATMMLGVVTGKKVCEPAPCFLDCPGKDVDLDPHQLTLNKWDETTKSYSEVGHIRSHVLKHPDIGIFAHGPDMRPQDAKSDDVLPPVYFGATYSDKVFSMDSIPKNSEGTSKWPAKLKQWGTAIAPSTMVAVEKTPGDAKTLEGFIIAQGNPFWMDKGNHSMQINKGGLTYMSKDKCHRLWPTPFTPQPEGPTGKVLNTVQCHQKAGVCFFSAWKFYDSPGYLDPDCLHYCVPDDMSNPTTCTAEGVMTWPDGKKICRTKEQGGVHGFEIGLDTGVHSDNEFQFDLLLVFTGGAMFDTGVSSINKMQVKVTRKKQPITGKLEVKVASLADAPFGAQLWNDTVAKPSDVGCDHAWLDDSKKYVWVSTFRRKNDGLHLLEYATGKLLYSIHGFNNYVKAQYSYSAGVSGVGTYLQQGSMIAMCTSTMPHVPNQHNTSSGSNAHDPQVFSNGTGMVWLVDIGQVAP